MVYTMLKTILLLKEENGYRIVQFKLIKLSRENSDLTVKIGCIVSLEYTSNGNVKSETRSIGVSDSSFKDISANSNYAASLLGKKAGDNFGFGAINGKIISIRNYMA